MKEFTFFPYVACNGAFLDLIRFTDGYDPGDGLCKNMTRFGKVSITDRREFQRNDNMNNDAGPYDMIVDKNIDRRRQRVRKLDWKTE